MLREKPVGWHPLSVPLDGCMIHEPQCYPSRGGRSRANRLFDETVSQISLPPAGLELGVRQVALLYPPRWPLCGSPMSHPANGLTSSLARAQAASLATLPHQRVGRLQCLAWGRGERAGASGGEACIGGEGGGQVLRRGRGCTAGLRVLSEGEGGTSHQRCRR